MTDYKVALDVYNGPLDLLLFLIRRDEIDIYDIPIARITEQYAEYIELLQKIDPETGSEFLVLAATLIELKSRTLLPNPPVEETDEEIIDPRLELVRQLLEYKKYKDVARSLEDSAAEQALRHARSPALPASNEDEIELERIDIWDLYAAFDRMLRQTGKTGAVHEITVDDTPVALHAADIADALERAGGAQQFDEVFQGRSRSEMIGLFLALLELIRQHRVKVVQKRSFGPIHIVLLDATPLHSVQPDTAEAREDEEVSDDATASGIQVEDPTASPSEEPNTAAEVHNATE